MNLNLYNYDPFPGQYASYQQRNKINATYRPPTDLKFGKLDQTMKGCFLDNRYACGPAQNFDHLNNPYDRLVNKIFIVLPYCRPYYTSKEPHDEFGRPISLTYYGYNTQKN